MMSSAERSWTKCSERKDERASSGSCERSKLVAAAGRRSEQTERACVLDRLGAPVCVELGVDMPHVRLDRAGRDVQLGGDLGRGQVAGQIAEHAELALAQVLVQLNGLGG